jgi:hypothetical protein
MKSAIGLRKTLVVPAKAGTQWRSYKRHWNPSPLSRGLKAAGMTILGGSSAIHSAASVRASHAPIASISSMHTECSMRYACQSTR